MVETTALGAAMAAAFTLNLWNPKSSDDMLASGTIFQPKMEKSVMDKKFLRWKEAVERSFGWAKV